LQPKGAADAGIQQQMLKTGGRFMSRLRMIEVWTTTMVVCAGLAVMPKLIAGGTQTFTGKVSDAMCGAKHFEGNIAPADCVRACVSKRS
jgi:hypothetical protein